jgi:predicted dehydrogenase
MRDQIIDTAVGTICTGDVYYDKGLYHGGTHIIDLLMFFFGDVKSLWATPCHRKVKHAEGDISGDLLLNFETCSISVRPFDSTLYSVTELRLYGDKGSLALSDMWGRRLTISGIRQCKHFSAYYELDDENERVIIDGQSFMTHTYNHIRKVIYESSFDDSLEAAINTLRVIEVAATAITNGGGYVDLA